LGLKQASSGKKEHGVLETVLITKKKPNPSGQKKDEERSQQKGKK